MIFTITSPLGHLTISTKIDRITSVNFGDAKQKSPHLGDESLQKICKEQLHMYFSGKLKEFDLPLHYVGTPFQMKVWKHLRSIPYGQTMSYQAVAKAIGHPKAVRAVGTACKKNPLPILIPCHRVVSSTGKIGEYAGGRLRKAKLHKLESG